MTRLVTSGFEINVTPVPTSGDTAALTEVGAPDGGSFIQSGGGVTVTRDTSAQRSGVACLRVQTASAKAGYVRWAVSGVLDRTYFFRAYVKVVTVPTDFDLPFLTYASSGSIGALFLKTNGTLAAPTAAGTASAAVNDGAWHRVEFSFKTSATQANRTWAFRLDGVTVASGSNQTSESAAPTQVRVGITSGATAELLVDDVALNDDQGATPHNTYPGDGYVICLTPTADNSRGSWTGGAGGTTNLFDALNNTPPVGAAAPGTNASQIRADTIATTGLFDTQTYVAAGATAGHTAVGCTVVACTGEEVATGTKTGSANTVTSVNNSPAAGTGSLNYGLDIGAEGVWPLFWRWWASPFTAYASQPTLASGARLNIITTTASRVASACFLGLIVEMQPAAAPAATKKPRIVSTPVPVMRAAVR